MIESDKTSAALVSEAAYEAAAQWLQRLDDPVVKDEDLRAWLEWFDASTEHRRAFEELQPLYRQLHDLPADYRRDARRRFAPRPRVLGKPHARRRRVWINLGSAAAIILATVLGWNYWGSRSESVYRAPATQHRTIELADNSALVLGADSVVAVRYTAATRSLSVERGQAYFEVTHNVHRPFVVQAGDVSITAVGTEFNVERAADQVVVTVTDGVVEVRREGSSEGAPARVAVGERLVLPTIRHAPAITRGGVASEPTWRDGQIEFVNVPLGQVFGILDQHAPHRLIIEDPRVADLTYSGTVLLDHIDEWTASLPRIYAIRAVPLDNGALSFVTRTNSQLQR